MSTVDLAEFQWERLMEVLWRIESNTSAPISTKPTPCPECAHKDEHTRRMDGIFTETIESMKKLEKFLANAQADADRHYNDKLTWMDRHDEAARELEEALGSLRASRWLATTLKRERDALKAKLIVQHPNTFVVPIAPTWFTPLGARLT